MIGHRLVELCVSALLGTAFLAFPSVVYSERKLPMQETRIAFREYGRCVVQRHEEKAKNALRMDLSGHQIYATSRELVDPDCAARVGASMITFPGDSLLDPIAAALIERYFLSKPIPDIANVPPLLHRAVWPIGEKIESDTKLSEIDKAKRHDFDAIRYWLSQFGECVVRASPQLANNLLKSKEESAAETAAFSELNVAMSSCITRGGSVNFGKSDLRGSIARNFFRLIDTANTRINATTKVTH